MKKKQTSHTATIEKASTSPSIIPTTATAMANRNLFLIIKEYLRDPRIVALKYVFFLFCFCFTLIILIVHQ
jgi:hypothetical protein